MSYYTDGLTTLPPRVFDGGMVLIYDTTYTDETVQLYISGELVASQKPVAGRVRFTIPDLRRTDIVFALVVDDDEADTDYWADAFTHADTYGNRIRIRTPQTIAPFEPKDEWVIYLGDAGEESADTEVHRQEFYPGGRRSGGFGFNFGYGGFGWDGYECRGFGYNFGYGEFGYDCAMLQWESEPLPPGVYPYKVTVIDPHGNESTAEEGTVTLNTYARPATGLSITSYNKGDDDLVLAFTASPDIA